MEPKRNVISFEYARKKRRIQRLKFHLIKPTILAIIVLFLIYSVLVGSYFVQTQKYPESGFKKAKIEISNLQPSLISD